jgi:ABC-type multidrug transport system ATPase subunit
MLELIAHFRGAQLDRAYVRQLVDRLELDLQPRISTYSKGTRQKLGVVLALLARPPVLLLDEPTSGLDPLMQHAVREILRAQAVRGTTVFFSTHVLSEAALLCHRVGILSAGLLVALASLPGFLLAGLMVDFSNDLARRRLVARAVRQVRGVDHGARSARLGLRRGAPERRTVLDTAHAASMPQVPAWSFRLLRSCHDCTAAVMALPRGDRYAVLDGCGPHEQWR